MNTLPPLTAIHYHILPLLSTIYHTVFMLEGSGGTNSDHLVTVAELDRETLVNHVVMVTVEDGGTIPKSDVAIMNLTLTDVNDNEPLWTAGQGTTFDIREVSPQ